MPSPLSRALETLRTEFTVDAMQRAGEMLRLLESLERHDDREALHRLMQSFQHLAGSSGAFGFSEVGELARIADAETRSLIENSVPANTDQIASLKRDTHRILEMVRNGCRKCAKAAHRGCSEHPVESGEWLIQPRPLVSERPCVLALQDDLRQADWLGQILENEGYDFVQCDTVRAFDDALRSSRPDLVLLDAEAAGAGGYELARTLRASSASAALPIVFLASRADESSRVRALVSGADDYLTKPVSSDLLLSAIAGRITRARALRNSLERDGVTGLLTRTAFLDRLGAVAARLDRERGSHAALAVIDLDHFKQVNDRYGHPTGDAVLRSLAEVFRKELRRSDFAGRYGGEEFFVLLEGPEATDAVHVCERLLEHFRSVVHTAPGGARFTATFSAGLAPHSLARGNVNRWLAAADRGVYAAKAAGRNRVFTARSYDSTAAFPAVQALQQAS